jgi:predicted nucleic acid-binding protein
VSKINRQTTLFFDASVLVAGAHSTTGGSALLLNTCRLGGFTAQSSFLVFLEAFHTLKRKFPERSVARYKAYLAAIDWGLVPVPSKEELERYAPLIDAKDLHVLAAAVEGASQFLLTLDRRHILAAAEAVRAAGLAIEILRPGDFIRQYYPLHDEYASLTPAQQ